MQARGLNEEETVITSKVGEGEFDGNSGIDGVFDACDADCAEQEAPTEIAPEEAREFVEVQWAQFTELLIQRQSFKHRDAIKNECSEGDEIFLCTLNRRPKELLDALCCSSKRCWEGLSAEGYD